MEDIPKTAVLFEMTKMPFGLSNSSSMFQWMMEFVLQDLQWISCLVYFDDIVVVGADFEEHTDRVENVLARIKATGPK